MIPSGLCPAAFAVCSSVLPRLEACPASGCFEPVEPEKPSGAQWFGIGVHLFLHYWTTKGRDEALAYVRRKFKRLVSYCERIDLAAFFALPGLQSEVGFARNVVFDEVRRLRYPEQPFVDQEVYGKADVLWDDLGAPHVADYKCGLGDDDPRTHPQLLGLACAVQAETGVDRVRGSLVWLSDGKPVWRTAHWGKEELAEHAERERLVHHRVVDDRKALALGVLPAFIPGKHCAWCSCRPSCPAALR